MRVGRGSGEGSLIVRERMNRQPVLIAGAGIAGLTAAIALSRAGVPVLLAERRVGFSEAGAGLQLSPNATCVLTALGLAAGVGRYAMSPRRLDIRRWSDVRTFAGMPMQDQPEADEAPFWSLKRGDLQTALVDAMRKLPDVRLMVGRAVCGIEQGSHGVSVTIENERGQRERHEASALVGADGLWSGVRAALGDREEPRFLGYQAWRTLVPARDAEAFARARSVALWLGRNGHAVHYPVDEGRFVNLVVVRNGQTASQDWSGPGNPADLVDIAASAAAPLRKLIHAAPAWQVWSLFDRKPAAMAQGHVALIGDAAHPVLPFLAQGASMAVEDAGLLARLISPAWASSEPAALQRALADFARQRMGRVAKVQDTARGNGRMYHAGFPLSVVRDLALTQLGDAGMRKRYAWLYGWRMA
jgi:salicylate hydroxylase